MSKVIDWFKKLFLVVEISSREGVLHFRRYRLFSCRWFNVYIHRIYQNDKDHHCHSHPWNFVSFILWGGYREIRFVEGQPPLSYERKAPCVFRCTTDQFHKIVALYKPTTSLVITGRRKSEWGYQTDEGFMTNQQYREYKDRVLRCEDKCDEDDDDGFCPGGYDHVFEDKPQWRDVLLLQSEMLFFWPDCLIEVDDKDGLQEEFFISREVLPGQVFLYKNQRAYDAWEKDGWTPEHGDDMLSIYFGEDSITFVSDQQGSPTGKLVAELIEELVYDRVKRGEYDVIRRKPEPSEDERY